MIHARRRLVATALAALVLLSGVAAASSAAVSNGFIWRVERAGRIGWLVGSIHVLTPDYYPLPEAMEDAFLRSTTLVEEADTTQIAAPEVVQLLTARATYSGAETLKTQLSPETYRLVSERLARIGMPIEAFQTLRPWMIALTLVGAEMKRAGFAAEHGVDRHFFNQAVALGKKTRMLETVAEQLDMFASFPPPLQEAMLRETLTSLDSEIGHVKIIADMWRAGDAAGLERMVLAPMMKEPALYDVMIVQRNRSWMPTLEQCLAENHCFIVVGAAHLLGPDGLVAALKQKGYFVEQLSEPSRLR